MSSPLDSPDPLRLSTIQTPQSRRQSVKRELSSLTPRDFHLSPAKSVVLDRNDLGGSPWRIKVTVEAEPAGAVAREGSLLPTKAEIAPTVTVKVPLKGANDTPMPAKGRKRKASDADEWVPKRKPTPGRRSSGKVQPEEESQSTPAPRKRGRPRKSDTSVAATNTQEETAGQSNVPNGTPKRGRASPEQIKTGQSRASPKEAVLRLSPEVVIDRSKEPIDDDRERSLDVIMQPVPHEDSPRSPIDQTLPDTGNNTTVPRMTGEDTPPRGQQTSPRDQPHVIDSIDDTQNKRLRKGRLFSDFTGASFSPLPPRPSPTRLRTTKSKSVTFSSPIRQEYSPVSARHTSAVSRDKVIEEDKADAAMWRSMIAQSSDNIDYVESVSEAGLEDEDEARGSDDGDDTSVIPGDYTMMESEEFSMVSINSLPSAKENQSSFVSLKDDSDPRGQRQKASIFGPGEVLTPKAGASESQKQQQRHRAIPFESASGIRSTEEKGPLSSEGTRGSPMALISIGSATSYTPPSDPRSSKTRMSTMQSPGRTVAASSVRSAGRLPTPSSDMDNVAPSSPLASKPRGTRSVSTASRNPSETSRKPMQAPLSSPSTSSPHIAQDYSPLSNIGTTSKQATPKDLQARLRQKREDQWQRDREQVINRSTHAEEDQVVLVSDQDESEDSDTPDDQRAEPRQNHVATEDEFDVWEEEASRDSLQNGRRHRGARRGQVASQAPVESSFAIDDTLPSYPPKADMKTSTGLINQPTAPAIEFQRKGFFKRDLIATPVRQKRNAADIDAIFANLGKGTATQPVSGERSPPRQVVAARQLLQPPLKLSVPVIQNDQLEESTIDQSVLTTSMLDATTSDVHQIRAEILSAKRAGTLPAPRVEQSSPTPTVRSSRTRASSELSEPFRYEKRQKLMQPTLEEEVVHDNVQIDEAEDLADGSITNITHASSSLLSLTPKREKSSYKALFSSPINPRTPHILPGPAVNNLFVNADSAPSPPSILESGSPISPPQPSLMSKFLSTIGQGYKPPSRPSHPLLRSLPLLPKIEPFTRTHWQVLHGLYDHCLQYPDLFAPLRLENVSYVTPELAKYIDIEIINWGYGVRLNERLVMVARIFYDLLVLKDVAEYENLYRMRIDRGETCTDRPDGLAIDLWTVLLKVFGIRCGRMMRSDEDKGKVIDRRPGQLRWRFKGEKEWTWAGRM